MNGFRLAFVLLAMVFSGKSFAVCSSVFPSLPYSDVVDFYSAASDSERELISQSATSVGLVFDLLMKGGGKGADFSGVEWRRDDLLIEYMYFSGLMNKQQVLDAAIERNLSSVVNAEVVSAQGNVDASIEGELVDILTTHDSSTYYSLALIGRNKNPKFLIGWGPKAWVAVQKGDLRALGILSDFYKAQGCNEYSELAAVLEKIRASHVAR